MPKETLDQYVARKQAKGTWATPKPHPFAGRQVFTGICPCHECGHDGEPMLTCDPGYHNCQCCAEVCS